MTAGDPSGRHPAPGRGRAAGDFDVYYEIQAKTEGDEVAQSGRSVAWATFCTRSMPGTGRLKATTHACRAGEDR